MKKLITVAGVLLILCGVNAYADTYCWTDAKGNAHCTTVERPKDDITPKGW